MVLERLAPYWKCSLLLVDTGRSPSGDPGRRWQPLGNRKAPGPSAAAATLLDRARRAYTGLCSRSRPATVSPSIYFGVPAENRTATA